MKNIIIISSYADTDSKKSILFDYIKQLKKLSSFDIMLVSHISVPENILNCVNYFIYDSDNFLLPIEKTPTTWVVYNNIKINILSCRHGYAFIKNVHNALTFAKSIGYDNFIFSDYDAILGDEDIIKIENIPNLLKEHNKKVFIFKDYNGKSGGYAYESKFFAGDVNYFIDNVPLPNCYEQWVNMDPYKSSNNIVEDILVSLLNKFEDKLYVIKDTVNTYFSNSDFDVFHHYDYKYSVIYNLNDKSKPIFFCITPTDGNFELFLNNTSVLNITCDKGYWLLHYIDVNEQDTELIFKRNNETIIKRSFNINSIEDIKRFAVVHTI